MKTMNKIFQYQHWQWLSAILLIFVIHYLIAVDKEYVEGSLWQVVTSIWLWLAVSIPILHQFYVWAHYFFTEKPDMQKFYHV